ncbi:hypothetical protein D0T87_16150 [Bacteroides sp. 51]|nr:hypothetical protein [Bacteroides sp. 51]
MLATHDWDGSAGELDWKGKDYCRGGSRTAQCTEYTENHFRAVREPPLQLIIYIKTPQKRVKLKCF